MFFGHNASILSVLFKQFHSLQEISPPIDLSHPSLLASLQTYPRSPKSQSNQHKIRIEQNQTIKSTSPNSQGPLLVLWNKHNLLDLHLIEDIVSLNSLAHRHELVGHEAISRQQSLRSHQRGKYLLKLVLILLQHLKSLWENTCKPLISFSSPQPQSKSENSLRTGHLPICILRFLP